MQIHTRSVDDMAFAPPRVPLAPLLLLVIEGYVSFRKPRILDGLKWEPYHRGKKRVRRLVVCPICGCIAGVQDFSG
jgi:hypothetical protein